MAAAPGSILQLSPSHAALFDEIGLTAETVFTDPRIQVWRTLPDRENAKIDFVCKDGSAIRLHIKRYPPVAKAMATHEINGYQLLTAGNIPAASIIAHGSGRDGSSFVILEDLAGYTPADKLLEQGFSFDRLSTETADLTALLHNQRLHHRDLYLCHFMIKPGDNAVNAKLIDMARVAYLNNPFTRRRWIVKDLAQFWYSTQSVPVTDAQREQWLQRYCESRKISAVGLIGKLNAKQRPSVGMMSSYDRSNLTEMYRSASKKFHCALASGVLGSLE